MHALKVTAAGGGLLCARCLAAMNVLIVLPGALDTFGGADEPWASVGHAWCARAVDLPLAPLPDWAKRA